MIKRKHYCWSRKTKISPVLLQQRWWGNYLMSLKACSSHEETEQRIYLIARELDNPRQASSPNFLATIWTLCSCFLMSEWSFNNFKLLPHHHCCGKTVSTFIFLLQQQHFIFIQEIWNKRGIVFRVQCTFPNMESIAMLNEK